MDLADRQELAVRYMPFAQMMAQRFARRLESGDQWEEYEGPAMAALWEAALAFDDGRDINFAVFARHRIAGALSDHRRWLSGRPRLKAAESDRTIAFDPGLNDIALADAALRQLEDVEELEAVIRTLPVAHRPIARLLLLDGLTLAEASRRLGFSHGYAWRLRDEIGRRLGQRRDVA